MSYYYQRNKKGDGDMNNPRNKLMVCLIFVILITTVIGCIYYYGVESRDKPSVQGTLIKVTSVRL